VRSEKTVSVLDAFAVLAWALEEPGGPFVRELAQQASDGAARVAICLINLGEVYYRLHRERGRPFATEKLTEIHEAGIEVVPVTDDLVWAAAQIKAENRVSYADAFAIATALELGAPLVTNDPEIAQSGLVRVEWQED
jgi:ribonuclease VapC